MELFYVFNYSFSISLFLSFSVGYIGADQLGAALKGCEVVVIPAGVPRKPGVCVCYSLNSPDEGRQCPTLSS